jgi:hypothetical protein
MRVMRSMLETPISADDPTPMAADKSLRWDRDHCDASPHFADPFETGLIGGHRRAFIGGDRRFQQPGAKQ